MLRIAEERGVAVDDLADLAKVVAALDVDSPIPLDALAAVSEILVYLFQADASLTQSGDAP
ncbi:MAG TPA: hypothetical protein VEU47_18605 [Candidatus Cybelea sp.]|nr:hypothetical protein [Candidatus Cybelea sp.]